jgi:hypothetical protein
MILAVSEHLSGDMKDRGPARVVGLRSRADSVRTLRIRPRRSAERLGLHRRVVAATSKLF